MIYLKSSNVVVRGLINPKVCSFNIAIALLVQNISVRQNEASACLCGISQAKMNVPQHILLRTPRISVS